MIFDNVSIMSDEWFGFPINSVCVLDCFCQSDYIKWQDCRDKKEIISEALKHVT